MPICLCRLLALLSVLLASCVNVGSPQKRAEKALRLSHDLQKLSPTISPAEADKLATTAVETAADLSHAYKPMCLPWANNALRNMGLRERGLCYEWRDDLFPHLFRLNLKTMDLHLTSARRAMPREHNGIVVTAKGQPFKTGIALDPWRKGGRLEWGTLDKEKYPWEPLPWELTPMVLRPYLMPHLYPKEAANVRKQHPGWKP